MIESKTTKPSAEAATQVRQQRNTVLATLRRKMAKEGVTVGREADGRIYITKKQGSDPGVVKAAIKHRHSLIKKRN